MVARRVGVAVRLVVRRPPARSRRAGPTRGPPREAGGRRGCSPRLSGASMPRKNSVTHCSFTSSPSSVLVSVWITSAEPLPRCEERDGRGGRDERHPGLDRPVQHHVLARSGRRACAPRRSRLASTPGAIASQTGTIAKTGVATRRPRCGEGRRSPRRSRGSPRPSPRSAPRRPRDAEPVDGRSCSSCVAHTVIPVVWPPLAVITWPVDEVRPRRAEEEDRPGGLLGRGGTAERDDLRRHLAHLLGDPERDLDVAARERLLAGRGAVRRVSTNPNATAFTFTFDGPHSRASVFVSPTRPAFAAE